MRTEQKPYNEVYEEKWKKHVETNGEIDADKVARELADCTFIIEQYKKVLAVVTKDMISKPFTYAEGIIDIHRKQFEDKTLLLEELAEEIAIVRGKRDESMDINSPIFGGHATEYFRGYEDALEYVVKYVKGEGSK